MSSYYNILASKKRALPQPLLLDLFPNAAVAYSLRKLRTAYSGSAIRVRRSSDNTEQDIGFMNNSIDNTSLLSFVGAGNGFVVTWYDQSTNANNVTQSTASRQPLIVSSGGILTRNGKQYVRMFQGATGAFMEGLLNTPIATVGTSSFLISSPNSTAETSVFGLTSTATNNQYLSQGFYINGIVLIFRNGTQLFVNGLTTVPNQTYLTSSHVISPTNRRLFVNNINSYSSASSSSSFNATYVSLNRLRRTDTISGFSDLSEFIIYPTEKTADRNGIETNINQYYGIY